MTGGSSGSNGGSGAGAAAGALFSQARRPGPMQTSVFVSGGSPPCPVPLWGAGVWSADPSLSPARLARLNV